MTEAAPQERLRSLQAEGRNWSKPIASVQVRGIPVPQGSMRAFKTKGGKIIMPQATKLLDWRRTIGVRARQSSSVFIQEAPVCLRLWFLLLRPKTVSKKKAPEELACKRPDIDKLVRAILDALQGVWYSDDSQVIELWACKRVALQGVAPGARIEMWST